MPRKIQQKGLLPLQGPLHSMDLRTAAVHFGKCPSRTMLPWQNARRARSIAECARNSMKLSLNLCSPEEAAKAMSNLAAGRH